MRMLQRCFRKAVIMWKTNNDWSESFEEQDGDMLKEDNFIVCREAALCYGTPRSRVRMIERYLSLIHICPPTRGFAGGRINGRQSGN